MLDSAGAIALWILQMAGSWALAGLGFLTLVARVDFSGFAVVRSLATAAWVVTLAVRYGLEIDGFNGLISAITSKYLLLGAVAGALLVVLGAVYVAVGRRGTRKARLGRLFWVPDEAAHIPGPVTGMLYLVASGTFLVWALKASTAHRHEALMAVSVLIVILPVLAFLLIVPVSVSGTVFNAGNAHPALPALAAPLVFAAALVAERYVDGVVATPDGIRNPLAAGGLAVITVASAVELVVLRRRGLGLTADPPPRAAAPSPPPSPSAPAP